MSARAKCTNDDARRRRRQQTHRSDRTRGVFSDNDANLDIPIVQLISGGHENSAAIDFLDAAIELSPTHRFPFSGYLCNRARTVPVSISERSM